MSTSSGYVSLGTFNITTAGEEVGDWVTDFDIVSITAQLRLAYGSGGTTIKAYLQTSLDQGTTPIDIACFTFTTASAIKVRNLSGLTSKTTDVVPTDGALTDDTSVDGILGDMVRVKVVSVGTYAGSTILSCAAIVR